MPRRPLRAGRWRPGDSGRRRRRGGPLVHQGCVGHSRSRRHASGRRSAVAAPGRPRRPRVSAARRRLRSKAIGGAVLPGRTGPVGGRSTGKRGPSLTTSPGPHRARHRAAASASASVKGGAKHSTLRPPQRRSRLVRSRASRAGWRSCGPRATGPRAAGRAPRCESGRQDHGITEGPLHEHRAAPSPPVASGRSPATPRAWRNHPSTARQVRAPDVGRCRPDGARPASGPLPPSADVAGQSGLGQALEPPAQPARSSPVSRTSSSTGAGSALRAS